MTLFSRPYTTRFFKKYEMTKVWCILYLRKKSTFSMYTTFCCSLSARQTYYTFTIKKNIHRSNSVFYRLIFVSLTPLRKKRIKHDFTKLWLQEIVKKYGHLQGPHCTYFRLTMLRPILLFPPASFLFLAISFICSFR